MSTPLLLRPALYYPYIHFRAHHLDWLKETLLSFRQVRRMVPPGFELNDPPAIARLREIEIPHLGAMIGEQSLDESWPQEAQGRLLTRLRAMPPQQLTAFDRAHAALTPGGADGFQIHVGKLMHGTADFLETHGMAWQPEGRGRSRSRSWLSVHPRMGEAIMSVMALAVAEASQLNIVTTDADVHRALTTRREEDIFDSLLEKRTSTGVAKPGDGLVDGALQLIIGKQMDLSWVSFDDVAAIVREGNDFQRFRVRLQELAANMPPAALPAERKKQIAELAAAARTEWEDYRKGLGSFGRMFVDSALDEKAWPALSMFGAAATGYASLGVASLGAGLFVGLAHVVTKTVLAKRIARRDSPYRYLSRLTKAGAVLVADLPTPIDR